MLDRRSLLLVGAATLAGNAAPAFADVMDDADFRRALERLGQRTRRARPFLLRRIDAERLSTQSRIVYDALLPGAEADAALSRFAWGQSGAPYPVTHRNGLYRRAAELRAEDRPGISVRAVNNDSNRLQAHAARGVIAPDFVLDATIPVVQAAAQRVARAGERRYEALAEAMTRQVAALQDLRARATSDAGVGSRPDGEEYYAHVLQFQLGAPVNAREAHTRALDRCRDLQSRADALLGAQGLVRGNVGERLRALAADERYLYARDDAGKTRALAEMGAHLERVRALAAPAIDAAEATQAIVQPIPATEEANAAAGRRHGSTYFVDLSGARPSWTLPSVVSHELIPGHILQAPFERAARPTALQLRYASGYSEGWAIYAEQLADELGFYEDDPLGRIGYLQWMLFRMGRIVADTGIHALGWSRERAIDEIRTLQGDSIAFVSISDDVTRIAAQPGAYAAQGLAMLNINDLRDATRQSVREAFALPRFHAAMLRHGPLSPPGLARAVHTEFAQS